MKSINEAIIVGACNGVPRRIRWDGHTYHTRKLLDYWIVQSRWWGREERRIYFRLETDRGVMEVYQASGFCSDARSTVESDARSHHIIEGIRRAAPPFIEGDTHTRELRQTDFPYRPDARYRSRMESSRTKQLHWMLSKILD